MGTPRNLPIKILYFEKTMPASWRHTLSIDFPYKWRLKMRTQANGVVQQQANELIHLTELGQADRLDRWCHQSTFEQHGADSGQTTAGKSKTAGGYGLAGGRSFSSRLRKFSSLLSKKPQKLRRALGASGRSRMIRNA
jgi:hypothetical protein